MANAISNIGFSDYAAEQGDIERRRAYAQALQQQSMQPLETQTAGGWAIPISPTQGLAKALQAYSGRKGMEAATAEQKALGQRARDEFTQWAGQMPQGTPAQPERYTGEAGTADELYNPAVPAKAPTQQELLAWALKGGASGNPLAAQMAQPFMAQALKMNEPYTLAEGAKRFGPGGQVMADNPKARQLHFANTGTSIIPMDPMTGAQAGTPTPITPQPTPRAPGTTRDIQMGQERVTQELQPDGTWKEVGRGPMFAKQVAPSITMPIPVTPVTIQDPKNPNATVVVDGRTGKVIGAGPKLTETGKANYKQQTAMQGLGSDLQMAEDLLMGNVRDSEGNVTRGNLPTGSGIGSLVDAAAGIVGVTPSGASEADALKVVAGRLVQKVPRFEGPQSDKDVALYKQMAADAGNEKLTRTRRLAAVQKMREIYAGYESGERGQVVQSQINNPSGGALGTFGPSETPPPGAVRLKR